MKMLFVKRRQLNTRGIILLVAWMLLAYACAGLLYTPPPDFNF